MRSMNKNRIIVVGFLILTIVYIRAQKPWTLKQCIDYALEHNIQVKKTKFGVEQQEITLNTQLNRRLPDLSGSMSESLGFGRALTSNNTYANRNTQSTGIGLSVGIPIFTGFEIRNSQLQAKLDLQAAFQDMKLAQENISIQVTSAFFSLVYAKEMVGVAQLEVKMQEEQLIRIEQLYTNGKIAETEVYEAKSILAQNKLAKVEAQNNYNLALLDLTQLLEMPSPEGFEVEVPQEEITSLHEPPKEVYDCALNVKPQIRAEELRLESAIRGIKIAQSGYYPTLSLGAGVSTSYYKTSGYDTPVFRTQLKDNFTQNIALSVNVPLFNRFQTRNSVRLAKVRHQLQSLQLEDTKKALYKEIQQAYYNAIAAQSRYESSVIAQEAARSAFELMDQKYKNGKANATEYLVQRTQLLKAQSDAIRARYDWIFRKKLLDFYKNEI